MLRTKSVHSLIDRAADGLRILATRVRGRGLRKTRYDVWMASLAPSERLLKKFRRDQDWVTFKRRYKHEILAVGKVEIQNRVIKNHGQKFTLRLIKRLSKKGNVTLLCHCAEEEKRCNRHLLKGHILRA